MIHILTSRSILAEPWIKPSLEKIILPHHQVVVLGFSDFNDLNTTEYMQIYGPDGAYHEKIATMFASFGIQKSQMKWIYEPTANLEESLNFIQNADIIYFPGGAPDLMMQRIHKHGLKAQLEMHQKIFIGSSAGAMIQFEHYHISPDREYPYFKLEEGLNLISDFVIEVHYRRRKKQKSSLRKVHKMNKKAIYVIADDGAIIYDQKHIHCIGNAYQLYNKKGVIKR